MASLAVELVLTTLHSGGKYGQGRLQNSPAATHGVGAKCVNAVSEWFEVESIAPTARCITWSSSEAKP